MTEIAFVVHPTAPATVPTAPAVPTSGFDPRSEDNVRFGVIVITAAGGVYGLTEVEGIETDKNDSGDAGTWSFSAPLALNANVAAVLTPMDIVALFAYRTATDIHGKTTPAGDFYPPPEKIATLTYGAPDAKTTATLGTASCLMIGMVDAVDEDFDYEGARMMLNANGRDLTKIFIDNDTLVPATLAEGGDSGALGGVSNIILKRDSSGTQLLNDILDVFVAKDPHRIAELLPTNPLTSSEISTLTQYGYPWRNFVRGDLLIDGFLSLTSGQLPTYAVQSGSAWANTTELRNYPITRLFVNELGQLVFDDSWTAWGFGSATGSVAEGYATITPIDDADIRHVSFRLSDDDVVTSLSIVSAPAVGADTALAGIATFGKQRMSPTVLLSRFGYRYQQFVSQYDGIAAFISTPGGGTTTDQTANVLNARYPILWTLHNNMWSATFTLKGNTKWRVGQRIATIRTGSQPATQPQNGGATKLWYVTAVKNSLSFGSDWVTTLSVRFPLDAPATASTAAAAG